MKICHLLLIVLLFAAGAAGASEERYGRELTCLPVNGYIQLPGIAYDDLTPLARETFDDNPAAVTNALYSLPYEEREDFINLYLEPIARERHRYFFFRCREVADRRAAASMLEGKEIIPGRLREELQERQRVRLALHEGALPFRIGTGIVYIPVPAGYRVDAGPLAGFLNDESGGENLAVFSKMPPVPGTDEVPQTRRDMYAVVRHVREGSDNIHSVMNSYRTMVDSDWRLIAMYPAEASATNAESAEYRWNLQPFSIRDASFCYGQFEKVIDFHGVNRIRYRATAVVTLPGLYIQVSIVHAANTDLDVVNEMNRDLANWRDAILAVNQE